MDLWKGEPRREREVGASAHRERFHVFFLFPFCDLRVALRGKRFDFPLIWEDRHMYRARDVESLGGCRISEIPRYTRVFVA